MYCVQIGTDKAIHNSSSSTGGDASFEAGFSKVAVVIHRSTHTTQDKHTTQSIGSSDQFTVHDFNKLALDVMYTTIVIPDAYAFVLRLELLSPSPFVETNERNKQN